MWFIFGGVALLGLVGFVLSELKNQNDLFDNTQTDLSELFTKLSRGGKLSSGQQLIREVLTNSGSSIGWFNTRQKTWHERAADAAAAVSSTHNENLQQFLADVRGEDVKFYRNVAVALAADVYYNEEKAAKALMELKDEIYDGRIATLHMQQWCALLNLLCTTYDLNPLKSPFWKQDQETVMGILRELRKPLGGGGKYTTDIAVAKKKIMQYYVNAMMTLRGRRVNLNFTELLDNVKHQDVKNILRSINDLNTDDMSTSTCPVATLIRIMVDRNIGDIASNISERRDLGSAKIITELFIHHCIRLYHTDIFISPDDARYIAELSEWVGDTMYDIANGKDDGIKQDYREIWYTAISSLFTKDVFSRDLIEEETRFGTIRMQVWNCSSFIETLHGALKGWRKANSTSSWVLWTVPPSASATWSALEQAADEYRSSTIRHKIIHGGNDEIAPKPPMGGGRTPAEIRRRRRYNRRHHST